MRKVSDGVAAYNQNANLAAGNTLHGGVGTSYNTANQLLTNWWANKAHTDQYDWDVGAWYGAYMRPGHPSRQQLLAKLFTVMHLAGVMYNNHRTSGHYLWRDCDAQGIPLGAILAHGGRMVIQLPMRTVHDDPGTDFFNWLTHEVRGAGTLEDRTAATHALSHRAPSIPFVGDRRFRIAEERGKLTGLRATWKTKRHHERNHFGVNLPLFGAGNTNWFSGNTVDANGGHGHLYIYFNPKEPGQCAGMMIGGENSGVGATSQTFVGHDFRAKSEKFSPAGTYKWPDMDHGPWQMTEEFVLDLSDGWTQYQGLEAHFDPRYLDYTPTPVTIGFTQVDPKRVVAYALTDVLDEPGRLSREVKRRLSDHLDTLLGAHNLPRSVLTAIITEINMALGVRQVQIAPNGAVNKSNALTVNPSHHMQTAIAVSMRHWGVSV